MKISNIKEYNDLEIINIIITLISDYKMFISNWGEFIFGKDLNLPPEHKNKIFVIWFSGSIDSIIDYEHQFEPLIKEAKERNLENCIKLLYEFESFIKNLIDNVSLIDSESQILLQHYRNTIVHARVFSIHNKKSINLRFYNPENNSIEKFKGSKDDFWEIHRKIITESMDNFIEPLRVIFFDKLTEYYKKICAMSKNDFFERLTKIAYLDKK